MHVRSLTGWLIPTSTSFFCDHPEAHATPRRDRKLIVCLYVSDIARPGGSSKVGTKRRPSHLLPLQTRVVTLKPNSKMEVFDPAMEGIPAEIWLEVFRIALDGFVFHAEVGPRDFLGYIQDVTRTSLPRSYGISKATRMQLRCAGCGTASPKCSNGRAFVRTELKKCLSQWQRGSHDSV